MGVWSSISFCHFERRKCSEKSPSSRKCAPKQILKAGADSFSLSLPRDVKEIRIQESLPEILMDSSPADEEGQEFSTNFEYSMGGNLDFYKEHLKQDYLEARLSKVSDFARQRNVSVSDNDSEPESLRYSRKVHATNPVDTITEEHEAELSFDDYSTIYQPQFLLNNMKSQSTEKNTPRKYLETKPVVKMPNWEKRKEKKTVETSSSKLLIDKRHTTKSSEKKNIAGYLEFQPVGYQSRIQASFSENIVDDIKDEDVFDYDDFVCSSRNPRQQESPHKHHDVLCHNEISTKRNEPNGLQGKLGRDTGAKQSVKVKNLDEQSKKERNLRNRRDIIATESSISASVLKADEEDGFLLRLTEHVGMFSDESDRTNKGKTNYRSESEMHKEVEQFYPDSPIAEVNFLKTPCSTRHNSLELLTDYSMDDCTCESIEKEPCKTSKDVSCSSSVKLQECFTNLPKEFQEMARRLSKKDETSKSSPSLHHVNSLHNFNCSSSSCCTISPRSPNGRTLSRTPSYKIPKTPSLSRHHPATYVTQHTSSRSRPSSRVSSRATSPTHENFQNLTLNDLVDYTWRREAGIQHFLGLSKNMSPKRKNKFSKIIQNTKK